MYILPSNTLMVVLLELESEVVPQCGVSRQSRANPQRRSRVRRRTALLHQTPFFEEEPSVEAHGSVIKHRVPAHIARRLWMSRFSTTWNLRVFEFGAVLYLATTFEETLLPLSVYAFMRGAAAIAFAPAMGQYIDSGKSSTSGPYVDCLAASRGRRILNCVLCCHQRSPRGQGWRARHSGARGALG